MTLKIVFRDLQKRPFLNFIKVAGLGLAMSGLLLIALLTVSLQTWRTSRRNPVEALRYE